MTTVSLTSVTHQRFYRLLVVSAAFHAAAFAVVAWWSSRAIHMPPPSPIVMVDLATVTPFPDQSKQTTHNSQPASQKELFQQKSTPGNPELSPVVAPGSETVTPQILTASLPYRKTEPAETLPRVIQAAEPVQFSAQPGSNGSRDERRPASPVTTGSSASHGEVAFGSSAGPVFRNQVQPTYPLSARRFNREGKVLLRLTIDEDGALKNIEVLEDPGYGFADAAVQALKKSSFQPAKIGGKPFTSKALLPIKFALGSSN